MKYLLVLVLLVSTMAANAGFVLTEENDAFSGSDDQYTQGLELKYVLRPNGLERYGYGIRSLIYTPKDITISEPQPDDRPWAGVTGIFVERWKRTETYLYRLECFLGMTGEKSYSGEIQTWFHEVIDGKEPMGWDNQTPNEPVLNFSSEIYFPVWDIESGHWSVDATMVGGIRLGTAFMSAESGVLLRSGYNVPEDYKTGLVKPTAEGDPMFSYYLFCEVTGRVVAHNVTLGGSLFQDGPEVDMIPLVTEGRAGVAIGVLDVRGYDFAISYSLVLRSPEFEGQDEAVDFGSISISLGMAL